MKKQIILTFDLEEWFHLCLDDHPNTWDDYENRFEENIDFILCIHDDHGSRATFLVLGWIAQKYPKIIRKIYEQGHDVGSHSNNHELIYQQSKSEFESDLIDSINILEDMTTVTVRIVDALVGDQAFNSPATLSAFALGLALFVVTLILNIVSLYFIRKFKEKYKVNTL